MTSLDILVATVPGFSMLSLGSIVEPIDTLGRLADDVTVRLNMASLGDADATSVSGLTLRCPLDYDDCQRLLRGPGRPDALFLCLGLTTPLDTQPRIRQLLRSAARNSVPILGVGCSGWWMVSSGVLTDGPATVHWSTLGIFAEYYPHLDARDALYVTGDRISSSPGEAAALDLTIRYIAEKLSPAHADLVCSHLMISYPRDGSQRQPKPQYDRLREGPKRLHDAIAMMEANIETPLKIASIARDVGISVRQLERLFNLHLATTPRIFYRQLRLRHARQLIGQTAMTIEEIAIACGFEDRRAFTRYYKTEFGVPPLQTRKRA